MAVSVITTGRDDGAGQAAGFTAHGIRDILAGQAGQPGQNAGKKQRTSFSGWQIYELEKLFAETKYIGAEERRVLSR